jgi:hypothetical protein
MTPHGGQTVPNPQGTKRLTPAFFAAVATFISAAMERPDMALMKISTPESKGASSSGEDEMSAMRILTPLLVRSFTSGFSADEGRTRAVTACLCVRRYGSGIV